jgi:hypothetical protein
MLNYKITFNQAAIDKINELPKKIVEEIFPRVATRIVAPMKASIVAKLPDGQASGTRAKQSAKTRARFPHEVQLKNNVGRKTIRDTTGFLLIVGVSSKARHVNFDHGEKAKKGIGRLHKLWWIDGKHEVYATPKLRKQTQDIPLIVREEFQGTISKMLLEEIGKEVAKL